MKKIAFLFLFVCALSPAWGQKIPKIVELNYGIASASIVDKERLDSSPTKERLIMSESPYFQKKTDTIPALLGTQFAVAYRIHFNKKNSIPLTIQWTYPPGMSDPSGRPVSSTAYLLHQVTNTDVFTTYVLEQDYELVPGTWRLEIFYQGNRLYQRTFYLVKQPFAAEK